jgi:hypothetical protein
MRVDPSPEDYFTAVMRRVLILLVLGFVAALGCAHKRASQPKGNFEPALPSNRPNLTITHELLVVGKIVSANPTGRFVILNFPLGQMPPNGQRLNVYRQGLKVGEVRITGPQRDDNIVADISAGAATVGDDVREK